MMRSSTVDFNKWTELGQLLSGVQNAFSAAKYALGELNIGPEILNWLKTDEGQQCLKTHLSGLGRDFLSTILVQVIRPREKIMINLDFSNPHNVAGTRIVRPSQCSGWLTLEMRQEVLYADGREVVLFSGPFKRPDDLLEGEWTLEKALRGIIIDTSLTHPNVLAALTRHEEFLPQEANLWDGGLPEILFPGIGYEHKLDLQFVRWGSWSKYASSNRGIYYTKARCNDRMHLLVYKDELPFGSG